MIPKNCSAKAELLNHEGLCILKNAAQIEHFIGYEASPPLPSSMAGSLSQKHVQILKRWAERNSLKSENTEDDV